MGQSPHGGSESVRFCHFHHQPGSAEPPQVGVHGQVAPSRLLVTSGKHAWAPVVTELTVVAYPAGRELNTMLKTISARS